MALETQNCQAGVAALDGAQQKQYLAELDGWIVEGQIISKTFSFKDHFQVQAFVNAVMWISNTQNHHPDMEVGYNKVKISYTTHDAGGLTLNDFVCAARVNALGNLPA